ncbi:MAG: hypothetical protein KBT13_08715 [Bacteroidales bacterium]|nr:hypothetical protein [Candidatus Sodaliphilus limicaballi]
MLIKTEHGDHNVTGQGQGNLNTVLGAVGTLGTLMGGGSLLGGWGMNGGYGRNGYYNQNDPLSRVITKAEADLMQENGSLKSQLAIKESEAYTDKKIVETVTYVNNQMRRLEDKVDANREKQQEVNAAQMAHNAASDAAVGVIQSQIQSLLGVTKMFIPSSNVCDNGCGCGCQR